METISDITLKEFYFEDIKHCHLHYFYSKKKLKLKKRGIGHRRGTSIKMEIGNKTNGKKLLNLMNPETHALIRE